jgi:ankyrin repeat protein
MANRNLELVEAALQSADPQLLTAVGESWATGFGTEEIPVETARRLVERGAPLSVHAAAGFGFTDLLEAMLRSEPGLVHAKGGDGCTPLHFARDVETARLLVERGAQIDARDDDHRSTPAQWRIGKAPEVSRLLLELGATPDIFLAAALGDREMAARLIAADASCTGYRIGKAPEFPPIGHDGGGGTILQWTLAFNSFAHQVALMKGHRELFDFLYERSDTRTRLLVCCVLARRDEAEEIVRSHPGIVQSLPVVDLELLPQYCWETNTNYEAVRLMLDLGFPVAQVENRHGYSALHNAAWSGNAPLVDLLIARGAPVDLTDPRFNATPLGYAIYDCAVEKRHPEGEFAKVAESLLKAGSPMTAWNYPTGDAAVDEVLARYGAKA